MVSWRTDTMVDVQEGPPTSDQLSSILEYIGPSKAGTVVKDATGSTDALRKFKGNESLFQRPLVVDWNNGRAGTFSKCTRDIYTLPVEKRLGCMIACAYVQYMS